MKSRKKIIISFVALFFIFCFCWFDFFIFNNNNNTFKESLFSAGEESDVVIIFNPGGWGTVDFEKALDFAPIINNAKLIIEDSGHKVSIVQYFRTQDDLIGKVGYLKEMLFNFPKESNELANQINFFLEQNPDDIVLIAGLSNGAAFVDATMEKVASESVFALELGKPFWKPSIQNDNILLLNNNGRDILTEGELLPLAWTMIKSPFRWIFSKITGDDLTIAQAMNISGHEYFWQDIDEELTIFLTKKVLVE